MNYSNDKDKNFAENLAIISSRKLDFLKIFIEALKMDPESKGAVTPSLIYEIRQIIASLDPLLFLTQKERQEGRLYLSTQLKDLDERKIGEEIYKRMREWPDNKSDD